MKKYSSLHKGFTLVELMIVIAIIGILAAVLYPSLTGYLEGSRDGSRAKALANIALSLGTYQASEGNYPKLGTSNTDLEGCSDDLKAKLGTHATTMPTDPKNNFGAFYSTSGDCSTKGGFAYRILATDNIDRLSAPAYILGARLEKKDTANITKAQFIDDTSANLNVVKMTESINETKSKRKATDTFDSTNKQAYYAHIN